MDLSYATASELTAALRDGALSSRELLDHVVARIDQVNRSAERRSGARPRAGNP